jgi:Coenzyme PQQ synthesis protein D (PqqD)
VSEQLRLSTALEWRDVEGEIVALDLQRSLDLSANRSGAIMWRALSEGTTREELVELLTGTFAIDDQTAQRDVSAFLEQLDASAYLKRPVA